MSALHEPSSLYELACMTALPAHLAVVIKARLQFFVGFFFWFVVFSPLSLCKRLAMYR